MSTKTNKQTLKQIIMKTFLELGLELREDLNDKGININENFVIKVFGSTIEFILDDNGKRVFGGDVSVNGWRNGFVENGPREVKIGKGSMGNVDNTCSATVEGTLLMATAFMNWEEFAESCEVVMDKFEVLAKERLANK
tara:strand:- start:9 stop:425 length:417 start_codon:yes stop_codon:yes gene_type:complete